MHGNVEKADNVTSDCVVFWDVSRTTFFITNDYAQAASIGNLSITDCYDIDSVVDPILNGSITVSKTLAKYILENATLKIGDEVLSSNNTAVVNVDINGISCMTINPPGTYYNTFSDIRKDYAVHVYQDPYYLCIRKDIAEIYPTPDRGNAGLIDIINNVIYLNGKAQYLRYPFKETITSFNLKNIYDGRDYYAEAALMLDNEGLYVDEMYINYVGSSDSIAVINPAEYWSLA